MRRDVHLNGDLLGLDSFTRQPMELMTSKQAALAFDDRKDYKLS